ncbi:hypothetical protein ACFYZI_21225 [Streptomyces griseorubiginosus]|uniref:hypothetical protein n=1 Tax=Streptomyces griseorubiginosus TaxID=67304 RepID=UPI0013A6A2FF|nr:hypothetical protein [Streptomyces griseorubiginosus]
MSATWPQETASAALPELWADVLVRLKFGEPLQKAYTFVGVDARPIGIPKVAHGRRIEVQVGCPPMYSRA